VILVWINMSLSGLIVQILIALVSFILALAIVILFPVIGELFSIFGIAWGPIMAILVAIFESIKIYFRTSKGRAKMTACPKCGSLKLDFSISTAYGEEKFIIKCYNCGEVWSKD